MYPFSPYFPLYNRRRKRAPRTKFSTVSPDIDEKAIRDPDPRKMCAMIARAKAEALTGRVDKPALLVTADQVSALTARVCLLYLQISRSSAEFAYTSRRGCFGGHVPSFVSDTPQCNPSLLSLPRSFFQFSLLPTLTAPLRCPPPI